MPKPSVALCRLKPMISTVARPTAPAFADTPIARPSAKLCRPIAVAITIPVCSARRRAASAPSCARASCSESSTAAASPPATGAGPARLERSRRSIAEMPAVPTMKPPASSANSPSTWAKLPVSWRRWSTAVSIIASPCLVTSVKMNARIPTENMARHTRTRSPAHRTRPTGSPR